MLRQLIVRVWLIENHTAIFVFKEQDVFVLPRWEMKIGWTTRKGILRSESRVVDETTFSTLWSIFANLPPASKFESIAEVLKGIVELEIS